MIAIVRSVTPGATPVAMATFELVEGRMKAVYANKGFEREMESVGIFLQGKTLHPDDGQAFLDALPKVYARSTTVQVETSVDP